jgi:hypothetical protein
VWINGRDIALQVVEHLPNRHRALCSNSSMEYIAEIQRSLGNILKTYAPRNLKILKKLVNFYTHITYQN